MNETRVCKEKARSALTARYAPSLYARRDGLLDERHGPPLHNSLSHRSLTVAALFWGLLTVAALSRA